MKDIIPLLESALQRLDEYLFENPQHRSSVEFLKPHFQEALTIIQTSGHLSMEQNDWFQYAAPRIVCEGINDKALLKYIEGIRDIIR